MTKECCQPVKKDKPSGFLPGLLYGLLPHSFCIAFVVFSVLGVTVATSIFRKLLLVPYFFQLLVFLSLVFATISAFAYLKRKNCLSWEGIKTNRTYLSVLYGLTTGINLLFFMVIFPMVANLNFKSKRPIVLAEKNQSFVTLKVVIPCPGHAPLIVGELREIGGIRDVRFRFPNYFDVQFEENEVSLKEILGIEVFKTYPATML